jgi:3-(3-hydroxy-phenyl)propionate hydroxylase
MPEHAVVIAGGGPTGLMLAAELTLAGTDVVVVERRTSQELDGSRSGGLHARTIEVLDQRGVAERFISAGQVHTGVGFAQIALDITDFPTRHNYVLALWQRDFERILAGWVLDELGVAIRRGDEVVGLASDDDGVDVELSSGATLRAAYLVGCDGGRSVVRKAAGIDFPGLEASTTWMIAEVEMDEPVLGLRPDGNGIGPVNPTAGGGPYRVVLKEPQAQYEGEPTLADLRGSLVAAFGSDFAVRDASWISDFSDMSRQAASYRAGRVLVAGDAAHVHPPLGGQGLNIGVQDAVNLGWKLAQVVAGTSSDLLLDSYHDERHPVGAHVLQNTAAAVALTTYDERHEALREIVGALLMMDEPRRRIVGMISGLDVRYDLGPGHPLRGRRVPDLDLETTSGSTRVYDLLHAGRPVLLDLDGPRRVDIGPWAERVRLVEGRHEGPWELPLLGVVDAPSAVLIRPDGHVAWAGDPGDPELAEALSTWFGAAA